MTVRRAIAILLALSTIGAAGSEQLRIVVHVDNPVRALARADVSRLFSRKDTSWSAGEQVEPVDQREGGALRERFNVAAASRCIELFGPSCERTTRDTSTGRTPHL